MVNEVLPKKRITVDLVLALIFFVVFLIMLLSNFIFYSYIHFAALALFLVPPGVFYLIWIYQGKREQSKIKKIVIRTISIVVSVVLILVNFAVMYLNDLVNPVSDPIYYQRILRAYDYPQNECVAHFPKAIPVDAKNVKLYEIAGEDFLLKYDTTPDDINRIVAKYEGKAKFIISKYSSEPNSDIYYPAFYEEITGDGSQQLPDDFQLFFLDNQPGSDGEAWNHGSSSGIAISTQRCEVIYWYEWS